MWTRHSTRLNHINTTLNNLRQVPGSAFWNPRKFRAIWVGGARTLMPASRLARLWDIAAEVSSLDGAVVECGTYKGGSAFVLASRLRNKPIWLFDSWEGCPSSSEFDIDISGRLGQKGDFEASFDEFNKFLRHFPNQGKNVTAVRGWFENTLPTYKTRIGKISLLHLDGDWYESTKTCLECLFERVVDGGFIIIDDYGYWSGCRKAVDEFVKNTNWLIERLDDTQHMIHKIFASET